MLENTTTDTELEAFSPIDESEIDLCKALWVSAALQAVIDARNNSKKSKDQQYKRDAINWLRAREGEHSEFAMVCNLAGLDFEKTRTRLLRVARNRHESADFRCIKKALIENRGMELRSKYLARMRRQERMRTYHKNRIKPDANNVQTILPEHPLAQCG